MRRHGHGRRWRHHGMNTGRREGFFAVPAQFGGISTGQGTGGHFPIAGGSYAAMMRPRMAHRFVFRDHVHFHETDMAGIMHFANFFRLMERAEHAFFRSLGLSVVDRPEHAPEGERVGWPRVSASCDYLAPLRFEDEVEVELLIEEVRPRSLRYLFRVRKADGTLAAEGRIAAACVRRKPSGDGMMAVEIPERIRSRLEAAPAELLRRPAPPQG